MLGSDSLYDLELDGDFVYIGGHNYVGIVYVADPFAPVLVHEWEPAGHTGNPATVHIEGDLGLFGAGWDGLYTFDVSDPSRPIELGAMDTPDWVIDIDVEDGVVFASLGDSGIAAIDVSDPGSPLLISRLPLPGFASPLDVSDGYAFVGVSADPDEGLAQGAIAIVDVSDPALMELVDLHQGFDLVGDLEVSNGHVFMTDMSRGMFVFAIVTA